MGSLAPSSNCGAYTETVFLTIFLERGLLWTVHGKECV